MLFFVGTRFHQYTLDAPIRTECGDRGVWIVPVSYDDLFAGGSFPGGTYIFTDVERLSPHERVLAALCFRAMAAHPDAFRLLNDPAQVRTRYPLLRALHEAGLNDFDCYRAAGSPRPRRFPVFIKSESNHDAAVTDLLPDQASLDAALGQLEAIGRALDELVVIEFAGEPSAPGVWSRYTAFAVGGDILPDLPVTERHWMVKNGEMGLVGDDAYREHDAMIREARYAPVLKRAFELARIDWGRLDFGLVGGRPQIYEINTNPNIPSIEPPHPSAVRQATREWTWNRLTGRLAALATPHGRGAVIDLDHPLLYEYRVRSLTSAPPLMAWRP